MRIPLSSAAGLLLSLSFAQPPPGYYDPAQGLTGEPLKLALHDIIDNQTMLTYAQLWTAFQTTDVRGDGYVWDIYSDIPGGSAPYLFTFVTDQCGTYNSEGDCYNREHSVPQSWFAGAFPMYTDLHHLYPVDGWVNNKRGELPYGEVGAVDWTSQNGTRTGSSSFPGYSGTVCEPRDEFKGDLARTYFYMMTRYAPQVSGWTSDMFVNGDLAPWAETMMLAWSDADPVSDKETARNNAVYAAQGNRNPYIDDPQWIHSIWGPTAGIVEQGNPAVSLSIDRDRLLVRSSSTLNGSFRLIDALGRAITEAQVSGHEQAMDLSNLRGCYMAVWSDTEGTRCLRFVR